MNKIIYLSALLPLLVLVPNTYARDGCNSSQYRCYNDGYIAGYNSVGYTPYQGHSQTWCNGYNDGYNAAHVSTQQTQGAKAIQSQQNTTVQTVTTQGEIVPIPGEQSTGVLLSWNTICNTASNMGLVLQSCGDLVNSDGTLAAAGNTAKVCIVNGVELGYKAISLGVPYYLAVGGLGALAGMTGCGGIVDMSKIPRQDQFNQINQW
jgi:hypothetical protein